jgi:hypothetical protein
MIERPRLASPGMSPRRPRQHDPLYHRLSDAERFVLRSVREGRVADFDERFAAAYPELHDSHAWDHRTIRSTVLADLCVGRYGPLAMTPFGVRIKGARVVGEWQLSGATIACVVSLHRCLIPETIWLRDTHLRLINLAGSRTGSIQADRLRADGGVYLRHLFVALGEVRLSDAHIEGDLDCSGGTFHSRTGLAIRADRLRCTGSVFFSSWERSGSDAKDDSRLAPRAPTRPSPDLVLPNRWFSARGTVRLIDATIGANVVCQKASFSNPDGDALLADNARIGGALIWSDLKAPLEGCVSLANAHVQTLDVRGARWPKQDKLVLEGFQYESLRTHGTISAEGCLKVLRLQRPLPFHPQPYEQLVKVLRAMGHDDDARTIAIEKRREQGRLHPSRMIRAENILLNVLVGYGYRPWRTIAFMGIFIVTGMFIFGGAYRYGIMAPTKSLVTSPSSSGSSNPAVRMQYQPFNALVYSADVFLPIVDLQQETYWQPTNAYYTTVTSPTGARYDVDMGMACRIYMWLHIAFGWILSTITVAALTGLIKKD